MLYIEQILNALVIGTVYALMALGLSLIFGVLRLVNFAHAQTMMVGGFLYFYIATALALVPWVPFFLALVATAPFLYAFGLVIERTLLRPAFERRVARFEEYVILATFALGIFLQNLALPFFGPINRQPPVVFKGRVMLGGLVIAGDRLTAALLAFVIIGALLYFLYRTYPGKGLRAVAQSPSSAAIVGVNVTRTRGLAFGLGITLTGLAGALLGTIFLVSPVMGGPFATKAFVIVVLGGMGSVSGSIVGAFLLALVESLGSVLIPDPSRALAYKDAYGLLLLIIVLLVRPQGLFGILERRA